MQLPGAKKKPLTYWEKNRHLVHRMNCAAILEQEAAKGIPEHKRGNKLIKELTRQKPRYYIPTPFRGDKKRQLAMGRV